MMRKVLVTAMMTTALAACTSPVGPQDSQITVSSTWNEFASVSPSPLAQDSTGNIEHDWWKHFDDPTLDALMDEALANNKTLAIARARVEEAQANRAATRAQLLPDITASGTATRENLGVNTFGATYGIGEADLNASWELDLFGGQQARTAAAAAMLQSEQANEQGVRVGLLAEVARNYFDMRNNERQISIAEQNLATQQKTFELIEAQKTAGLASDFDLQRAGAEVSTTAAEIPALKSAYAAAKNRLNVLLGVPPGTKDALLAAPAALQPLDPHVLVAAPAAVIANRPDVRAAERAFAASISTASAATRDLFPKINLLGLYGVQDSNALGWAHPWSLGLNLVQPVLDFGRVESEIDLSDAQQKEAFANYQQTVLSALEDMENALTAYLQEMQRNASLQTGVAQNQRAADLAQLQFKNGEIALLDVLVADRNALNAESALAASDTALREDLVHIYAAAGGGWDVTPAAAPAPSTPPQAQTQISPDMAQPPQTQTVITPPDAPSNAPHVEVKSQTMVIQ